MKDTKRNNIGIEKRPSSNSPIDEQSVRELVGFFEMLIEIDRDLKLNKQCDED